MFQFTVPEFTKSQSQTYMNHFSCLQGAPNPLRGTETHIWNSKAWKAASNMQERCKVLCFVFFLFLYLVCMSISYRKNSMFSKLLFRVKLFNWIKQSMDINGDGRNLESLQEHSDSQDKLSSQRKYVWFPSNTKQYHFLTFHFTYNSKTKDKISIPWTSKFLFQFFHW